jgi:hypothetical protein
MENAAHVGAIVKMPQKQFVRAAVLFSSVVLMPWQYKSHTESGEVYQKMIASQLLEMSFHQKFRTLHELLVSTKNPFAISEGVFISN